MLGKLFAALPLAGRRRHQGLLHRRKPWCCESKPRLGVSVIGERQ
ncbi:hypothetical protein [Kitasatospora aureofaciens]